MQNKKKMYRTRLNIYYLKKKRELCVSFGSALNINIQLNKRQKIVICYVVVVFSDFIFRLVWFFFSFIYFSQNKKKEVLKTSNYELKIRSVFVLLE